MYKGSSNAARMKHNQTNLLSFSTNSILYRKKRAANSQVQQDGKECRSSWSK